MYPDMTIPPPRPEGDPERRRKQYETKPCCWRAVRKALDRFDAVHRQMVAEKDRQIVALEAELARLKKGAQR